MSLASDLDGTSALAEEMGFAGLLVVASVEANQGAMARLKLETFGARFGDDFEGLVVGMLVAKVDDSLLVLGREECEFGARFAGCGCGVHGVVSFLVFSFRETTNGHECTLMVVCFLKGAAEVCATDRVGNEAGRPPFSEGSVQTENPVIGGSV